MSDSSTRQSVYFKQDGRHDDRVKGNKASGELCLCASSMNDSSLAKLTDMVAIFGSCNVLMQILIIQEQHSLSEGMKQ